MTCGCRLGIVLVRCSSGLTTDAVHWRAHTGCHCPAAQLHRGPGHELQVQPAQGAEALGMSCTLTRAC